jgi:bifunctional non-homologous end joining protein LigD
MSVSRELQRQLRRIQPCLPRPATTPPSGPGWIHEIKHDGFRIIAVRDGARVRLLTRKGIDLARRFAQITASIGALPVRSCIIDGEAIVCDANGLAVFDLLRYRRQEHAVALCAFDLLELGGHDIRRTPLEQRKAALAKLFGGAQDGIGDLSSTSTPARSAARALLSKRIGSPYHAGRAGCWIKVKNPAAPAVTREAEGDWSK